MNGMGRLLLVIVGVITICNPVSAVSWVVFDIDRDFHSYHNPLIGPGQIVYNLDNNQLTLDPDTVDTIGGSSAYHWNLLFSGQWAVLGSIGLDDVFTPDPYAGFVETGVGEGRIDWAEGTPDGYTTNLILGGAFAGDGAASYQERNAFPEETITGTLVLHRMFQGGSGHEYEVRSNSIPIAYQAVPEPSSLIMFLIGLPGLRGLRQRRR